MAFRFDHPIVSSILIGRAAQVAAIDQRLTQAAAGRGQIVLVSGDAGIGKSRLVAETSALFLARWPRPAGAAPAILRGQCFEQDRALPYGPVLDLLRGLLNAYPAAQRDRLGRLVAPELGRLLPELAGLRPQLPPPPAAESPEQEKRRLFEALLQLFVQLTGPAGGPEPAVPLLLIVEDLHWCDDTSLDLLLYLARHLAAQPILLLLTYRSDELHAPLRHFLADLARARLAIDLPLDRLSLGETDSLIRAIFPQSQPVRADFLEALYSLTEGNPFFTEEILKSLLASGEIFYSGGAWSRKPVHELHIPHTVQDAVQRRTQLLSEPARRLLTVAAVAGRRSDFPLLQQVTGYSERDLLGLIKELIAAQLMVEESADRFAFRHALTRQAVYSELLARERKALHGTIAETTAQIYQESLDAHLADLAYHFYEAGAWEQALVYAQRAAEEARQLYALRAAEEQFKRAIAAAGHLARPPAAALYRGRAQVCEWLGEFEAAGADYTRAMEAAQQAGDLQAEWQSSLDLGFFWTGHDYQRAGAYLESALTLARRMGDPATLGHTLNRLGNWRANIEQPLAGRRHHEEALTIFEALDDRAGQAATLDLLGIGSLLGGDLRASAAYYERAVPLFRALDDRRGLASCLAPFAMRGTNYMTSTLVRLPSSPPIWLSQAEEAVALTRQTGWRSGEAFHLMYLSLSLGALGEYTRGFRAAEESLRIATEIEHHVSLDGACFALGALYLDLLAPEEAQPHTARAVALGRQIGSLFLLRAATSFHALTCAALGDFRGADAVLDAVGGGDAAMQTLSQRLVWCARAELELARAHPGAALEIVDRLIASATNGAPGVVITRLWYLRGQASQGLGHADDAEIALRAAQTAAAADASPPLLWRVLAALAHLYQAQGRRTEAAEASAAARRIVEELAARVPNAPLRDQFVRRAGALLPALPAVTPRRAAKQAFDGLTEREREVAALLARGQSNRQIATTLFLSQRTVQVHITNIMAKLDVTSRTQVAVWAVEKGLAGDGAAAN